MSKTYKELESSLTTCTHKWKYDNLFTKHCDYCGETSSVYDIKSPVVLESLVNNTTNPSDNNGGSTSYYKLDPYWKECGDIIEARNMNYNQGNIFKVAFTFNIGRHSGTDYERELNKIIWFANRELELLKKGNK